MAVMDSPSINILIVDDSRTDTQLTQLWLKKRDWKLEIQVARTVAEAMARLRREPPFEQAPTPHLILLDLNLPDTLGWDLLVSLRQDERLPRVPVMIVTGTIRDSDIEQARELGAVRCMCKPFDADEFAAFVREVESVIREHCSTDPK